MLGTLIKYEWKDTWLVGAVCNIGTILLSILGAIMFLGFGNISEYDMDEVSGQLMVWGLVAYFIIYVLSLIAVGFVMKYFFFYRYYKNLFTDQGYLMHTLPVTPTQLINAKLIVAVVWQYITMIVLFCSICTLVFSFMGAVAEVPFSDVFEVIGEIFSEMDDLAKFGPLFIVWILIYLITPISEQLTMYTAVGIGQMSKKNRFIISILVLFGINMVKRTLASFFSFFGNIFSINQTEFTAMLNIISVVSLIFVIGIAVGLYFLNKYFVEKKLNLE